MDPEARRAISRRGGEASHESGRGHEFNSEEAREAGRRGGEARWGSRSNREEIPEEEFGRTTVRSDRDAGGAREENDDEGAGPRATRLRHEEDEDLHGALGPRPMEPEERREASAEGTRDRSVGRSRQGFASMDPELQREIARRGGEASGRSRASRAR
jgi:general stress protein YciG